MTTPLGRDLRAMIAADGPIGVERYMQLCLQHPHHGYYITREAIGRDFVTAPEVHQMFGELLGLWAADVWLGLGAPAAIRLVELGPGRGTLMVDALRAARAVPGFADALCVDLVETSPRLRAAQREALGGAVARLAWHDTIADLPDGAAIVLANEFFDALPVRHYGRDPAGWHERQIGLDGAGRLCFGLARETITGLPDAPAGAILEIGHVALAAMRALAGRVAREGGALLVCDYGHVRSGFGETLQAVRGHRYAGVLDEPGWADLTAHVDFAALARAARDAGADVHGPVAQGAFLERLGLRERAARLAAGADPAQGAAIAAALARFAGPDSTMATLFKAMAVVPRNAPPPAGFADTGAAT